MKEITTKDLKQSLTLLLPEKNEDGEGGWHEVWKKGPRLWASLWPLIGKDGFHAEAKGGPMASQKGYIKALPPPCYRVIIRARTDLPLKIAFLWHLRQKSKRLLVVSSPILIQYNQFLSMTAVEESNA